MIVKENEDILSQFELRFSEIKPVKSAIGKLFENSDIKESLEQIKQKTEILKALKKQNFNDKR